MDPLTAFALFLAGEAVLPDAYTRAFDWARHRSNGERLAKEVKKETGHRTGHYFRQWYEREETWTKLVTQGQDAYQNLVESLDLALAKRAWGRPDRKTVEELVQTTIGLFVSNLGASEAIAVEGHRSQLRDSAHDEAEAARHSTTVGEIHALGYRLGAHATLPERAQYLPPGPRLRLLEAPDPAVALRLLDLVDVDDPAAAVAGLVSPIPEWLKEASPPVILAAVELALAYQVPETIGELCRFAAAAGIERGYCTARLALLREPWGEADSLALLNALAEPRGVHAEATAAVLAEDFGRLESLVTPDEAANDPLLASLRVHLLRQTHAGEEALIAFLADVVQQQPEAPGLLIALGEAHHQRSRQASATNRAGDRARARELLLKARDLRRRWRGDSAEPVAAACRLALHHGDLRRAVELGSEPPEGEALAREAADDEVRHVVDFARDALGHLDSSAVLSEPASDFPGAILQADVLGRANANPENVAAAYEAAWNLASEDTQKQRVWLGASAAGLAEMPGADELAAQSADFRALVTAQLALAVDRPAAAVEALRPFPGEELHVSLMAHALARDAQVDEAVAVLRAAAVRFNDPAEHLTDAVQLLKRAGRSTDAAGLAAEALQVVPAVESGARETLHEAGIADAWSCQRWGEAAMLLRALIADIGATDNRRWSLAYALYNDGDTAAAWAAIREAPAIEPSNAAEAQLWLILAGQEDPGPQTVKRMLELVEQYPDEPELAQKFVGWFFMMGDEARGDVDPHVVQRFQELLEEHSVEHDGSETMRGALVKISGSAEHLIEQLRPHLERRANTLEGLAEQVRSGYPYGMLTLAAGRSYTSVLVQRGAGALLIASNEVSRASTERDVARQALASREAVLDASTLVLAYYVRAVWPELRSRFRIEVTSPGRNDILRSRDELTDPRTGGSIYFDTDVDAVRVSDADPAVVERLAEHIRWIADELPHVSVLDWPRLVGGAHQGREEEHDDAFLAWMASVDMARSRNRPLWADDLGLRTLAINEGVAAFGTVALLEVLVEDGVFTGGQLKTLLRTLRQEYSVDLPEDAEWMLLSAGADEWSPGPACAYFTRPASWADFESTLALWDNLATAAAETGVEKVVSWFVHAANGLVRAARSGLEHRLIALLAARAVVCAGFDPETTGRLLRAARQVCAKRGHESPVLLTLAGLNGQLVAAVGPQEAGRILATASDGLDAEDRAVLRGVVLGLRDYTLPPATT